MITETNRGSALLLATTIPAAVASAGWPLARLVTAWFVPAWLITTRFGRTRFGVPRRIPARCVRPVALGS